MNIIKNVFYYPLKCLFFLLLLLLFIFLLPFLAITALLIRITLGSPVLFCQERAGLHGKPFTIYKFRTMRNELNDKQGNPLPESERISPIGRFIRKASLDELPQILNVLKGDMVIVGPRPLFMEYVPLYNAQQKRRLDVKPGITGWAQINGRNAISWDDKFKLDTWYVENKSFFLDCKILCLTVLKVVRAKDVNQDQHSSMEKFRGS
ncbi:MAG: sugar transferase [Gammaproteobacteria bacterium]|nr:sugar transferase [Gammaproteobacteria bacterium]